jgi:membrane protein involved in colicin uptake
MNSIIRAIAVAAIVQVVALGLLISYLFVHTDNMAKTYALLAERNANSYTTELVHDQYNRLQVERSQEREDMRRFVDRRIDLKINQAMKQK